MIRIGQAVWVGGLALACGCSFIDDFDYEYRDGGLEDAVVVPDGEPLDADPPPVDGPLDTGPLDIGTTDSGMAWPPCTGSCLGDGVADFSPDRQAAGMLQWRYLADTLDPLGLVFPELGAIRLYDAPAWGGSGAESTPAIVACGESIVGNCGAAAGRLLFEATQGQSAPVLAFIAPADGTFLVELELTVVSGESTVSVGRNGRFDSVAVAALSAGDSRTLAVPIDLFAAERGVLRVVADATSDSASVAVNIRVSTMPGVLPLAACQLATRFEETAPLAVECTPERLTTNNLNIRAGSAPTAPISGPAPVMGGARDFPKGSALRLENVTTDYSGDFTVQLWAKVDSVPSFSTEIFHDWFGAGGTQIGLEPQDVTGALGGVDIDVVHAAYLFERPPPPFDESILHCNRGEGACCDEDSCFHHLVAPLGELSEWHFYRMVRIAALNEVRFCIDGEIAATGPLPGTMDISSGVDPKLGNLPISFDAPAFDGAVDDLRVISRALPCGASF